MKFSKFSKKAYSLRSNFPITDSQLAEVTPSVFQEERHSARSERYTAVPTYKVVDAFRKEGFMPFEAVQTKCRDESALAYTKHMLRFRRKAFFDTPMMAEVPELILVNSHNGTSSYQIMSGIYRFVCQNGLVFGSTVENIKLPHKGKVEDLLEAAFESIGHFQYALSQVDFLKTTVMSKDLQEEFARRTLINRFGDNKVVGVSDLLMARRSDDEFNDAWTVLNRVQENVIKGGLMYKGLKRQVTTRSISNISKGINLNRKMWDDIVELTA